LQRFRPMLLFRSLSLGLIGACFLLQLGQREVAAPASLPVQAAVVTPELPPVPTIIDVSGGVDAPQLPMLIRLGRDEHVSAVDDRPIANDLEAGAAIVSHRAGYIDLTVASIAGSRRVLMLLH